MYNYRHGFHASFLLPRENFFDPKRMSEYAKHHRSTVHRHRERARYEYATVHSIVNTQQILHVSFLPSDPSVDPFPTTLPMIGIMASYTNKDADPNSEPLDVYIHGHSASRLMRQPDSSSSEEGVPVCVSATILDGIKLALTPFNHSCNYRSVVIHGWATDVTDEEEKLFALKLITDGLVPGRWDASRVPPTKAEMISTRVLKIQVSSASAKVNVGGPGDVKADLQNEDVVGKVWTGVLPVYEHVLPPQAGEKNGVQRIPEYIAQFIEEKNRRAKQYAAEAITQSIYKG